MGGYGYIYQSVSTYNTSSVRNETQTRTRGPVTKPFAPFVPKINGNYNYGPSESEGYITKKKIIPVGSSHDGGTGTGDEYEWRHQQRSPSHSPVRGSPRTITKVHNEAGHPARSSPVTSPDHWRHSSQPLQPPYNGYADYDYGTNNPIGGNMRINDNHMHDGYNNDTNYANKEGTKPFRVKDNHDGYNNGYGDYGGDRKPIGSSVKNDANGYGDRDHGMNKEGRKPIGGDYGGNYGNKEGRGRNLIETPIYNGYRGASPITYDNYDHENDYSNNKQGHKPAGPKPTSGWTASSRKGTPISSPTNDIEQAMELLKREAAKLNNNGGPKPKPYEYDDDNNNKAHQRKQDGPGPLSSRPAPGMDLVNETERLKKSEIKPNGNFNLLSTRPLFNPVDGRRRGPDRDPRRSYEVIDHKEAEKKFNGMTI